MLKGLVVADSLLQSSFKYQKVIDSIRAKNNGQLKASMVDSMTLKKLETMRKKAFADFSAIPDSFARRMHDFAIDFPQNPKSEEYLYRAGHLSEIRGRQFEAAKWCEDYVKLYPKGKYTYECIVAAGANFEAVGTIDKAIDFYTRLYMDYPKSEYANDARKKVQMLKMGLITADQQLEYLLKHNKKDSAQTAH